MQVLADPRYALALAAGMLATVNPCGFALLPTYLSLLVVGDGGEAGSAGGGRWAALRRALVLTSAMTAGFVAVFVVFGLVVTPLALSVERYLPWATVVIGVVLVGLGCWLVAGREVYVRLPKLRTGAPRQSAVSMVVFGVSYAVASLSCTVGPFLALTTSTLRSGTVVDGLAVFAAYAVGMGLVVGVLTLAVALARDALARRVRVVVPYVSRIGGGLLVIAGSYVAYFGVYEVRLFAGGVGEDPVVQGVMAVQAQSVRWLDAAGPGPVAVVFVLLVVMGVLAGQRVRG
jgi:cytochrome c-type biogenesis protein